MFYEGEPVAENVQQMLRDRLEDDGTAIATPDRTWTWRERAALPSPMRAQPMPTMSPTMRSA